MGATQSPKILVAHRGASAYAPEHTALSYELAVEQGADYIEPDLQITRDGVLVCLHDETLERTTNVREVFPDQFREVGSGSAGHRTWRVSDFDLEEVRRLDAGSWCGNRFAGARVPTFAEVLEIARGRAGVFPETKAPEVYGALGFSMETLVRDELAKHGLEHPGADPATPVMLQSFSVESLRILGDELEIELPLVLLLEANGRSSALTRKDLAHVKRFAAGIGPDKRLLRENPAILKWARMAGLLVIPWTFRSDDVAPFPDLVAEMEYYLYELGVDGLFTNHPDRFPRG